MPQQDSARPTVVTVIGWVWCALGAIMASAAVLVVVLGADQDLVGAPSPWTWMPALACVQLLVGAAGIVAGARLLALVAWARRVLEILTGLLIAMVVCVNVIVAIVWTRSMAEAGADVGVFRWFGVIVALISTVFYGGLLVLMLVQLRSRAVREAVGVPARPCRP